MTFDHSPEERYFEDYLPGTVHEFGFITVDEQEVIDFGKRYVPLSYHVDREAAQKSIYGGLIASGWQTAALMMRIYTEKYLSHVANLGSPGGDELRWNKPVFPGDQLSVRATVIEARRSESRPDRGIVRTFIEVLNQNRDVVMSLKMVNFVKCRKSVGRAAVSRRLPRTDEQRIVVERSVLCPIERYEAAISDISQSGVREEFSRRGFISP